MTEQDQIRLAQILLNTLRDSATKPVTISKLGEAELNLRIALRLFIEASLPD